MSNTVQIVLNEYGIKSTPELQQAIETIMRKMAEGQPPVKPVRQFSTGVYQTEGGDTAYVLYDLRWLMSDYDADYPLSGIIVFNDDVVNREQTWTSEGREYMYEEDNSGDLVMPEDAGPLHVHYVTLSSSESNTAFDIYPRDLKNSYSMLEAARSQNFQSLPILRVTYRGDKVVSAQLVGEREMA